MSENWQPIFSISGSFTMTATEAQSVLADIDRHLGEPMRCDHRFMGTSSMEEQLADAQANIQAALQGKALCDAVRFSLSFIQCFAIYQTLRNSKSQWRTWFYEAALYYLSKSFNRALLCVIEEMYPKDVKVARNDFLGRHLRESLAEIDLRISGKSNCGVSLKN